MTDGHPDLLELDAVRAGEAAAELRGHVERCGRCRAELEWLRGMALRVARAAAPPRRRRWVPFAAAAAAAVVVFGAWIGRPGHAAEDIDRDGRVDILDARALATRIGRGEREPAWDLNRDGSVDAQDVERVARAAVRTAPVARSRQEGPVRFVALDVFLDSGDRPLASWQFELASDARIVGIEGAKAPPYYDPAALEAGRIVIASFTTDPDPPRGRVRVARLHLEERGAAEHVPKLVAAGGPGGARIDARIEAVRAGEKR